MQMGLQPRVLKKQGTNKQTHESEGERLGAKCRHRNYGHKTQPRCLLPIGEDDVFQCIAWVVSTGSEWAEFFLQACSTLGKLVPGAESAWKLFSSLLDHVWWWVSKWTRSGCWNSQKHEFMTVCKVVSQFPTCVLNVNARYKSVRLEVREYVNNVTCLGSSYWWVGLFMFAGAWELLARQSIVNWLVWLQ